MADEKGEGLTAMQAASRPGYSIFKPRGRVIGSGEKSPHIDWRAAEFELDKEENGGEVGPETVFGEINPIAELENVVEADKREAYSPYRKPSKHRELPGARIPMTYYIDLTLVRIRRARSYGIARICRGDIFLSRCRVTTNHGQPRPKYLIFCMYCSISLLQ
jgi:hypothetical protein